jgi:DUF3011 family protein
MHSSRSILAMAALLIPYSRMQAQTIRCSASDGKKHYCKAETGAGVELVKQRSKSLCAEGKSWGFDESGIWVDHGCRGDFMVKTAAPSGIANGDVGQSCLHAAGEQKSKELVQQCLQVSPATHPPCNTANSCTLIKDEIKRSCQLLGAGAPGFCAEYK